MGTVDMSESSSEEDEAGGILRKAVDSVQKGKEDIHLTSYKIKTDTDDTEEDEITQEQNSSKTTNFGLQDVIVHGGRQNVTIYSTLPEKHHANKSSRSVGAVKRQLSSSCRNLIRTPADGNL